MTCKRTASNFLSIKSVCFGSRSRQWWHKGRCWKRRTLLESSPMSMAFNRLATFIALKCQDIQRSSDEYRQGRTLDISRILSPTLTTWMGCLTIN
ncbi:hypothetical protein BDW59DRAFT_142039 [Aspergillus cavernicola]|uniref:Uncharacterized protein n=1 Tax=Aspergillus cavernicola TaxID=176166 RepID=A0ABR4IPW3_9EURO